MPGPFTLGKWYLPLGIIAVAWVQFVTILLLFPGGTNPAPDEMSEFGSRHLLIIRATSMVI